MQNQTSIRICLNCNKDIFDSKIKVCPYCDCIDLMDKENYNEVIMNYQQASPNKKQYFYNDPVFIKIMCYHPDKFKRISVPSQINPSQQSSPHTPHCPTCNSTNVQKISVAKKATGFALIGIFSSNFGKTMQCKNCGYKW